MLIAVVGAGAVGSLLAGCLASAGHGVLLVRRIGPEEPVAGSLRLLTPDRGPRDVRVFRAGVAALRRPDPLGAGRLDAAVLAVKRFDLDAAIAALGAWPELPVVTVQNGVGAEEQVLARRPATRLVAASLTSAVEMGDRGEARWLTRGGIGLAAWNGGAPAEALARALAAAFGAGGMRAAVLRDPVAMKWSKLVANLVGNATGALLDMDVRAIYADPSLYEIERRQAFEALAVMRTLRLAPVALPGADVRLLLAAYRSPAPVARLLLARVLGGARGEKMPSLRLALRAGAERTEVAWLNGAVASVGARAGVPVPVNATLSRLLQEAAEDPSRRDWLRGRPDRLVDEVAAADSST